MKDVLVFGGGFLLGFALVAHLKKANESNCCQRVAFGARDTIAGFAGPGEEIVKAAFDTLGITKQLPSILDSLGVPLDGP